MNSLKVLYSTSEATPFIKSGGLADVSGSLPKYLGQSEIDIRVILPKYKNISREYINRMQHLGYIYIDLGWRHQYCGIEMLELNNIKYYFVDNEYYFKRDGLYGYFDDGERFSFFNKAILNFLPFINFKPDIIHSNDWQTAIVPLLLKSGYNQDKFYEKIKTVFTIHNLKYQGVFPKEVLIDLIGLGWEYFNVDQVEFYDKINFLKAGIVFSDKVTTVSKTYAKEIMQKHFGENLNDRIKMRSDDFIGIINGIDYEDYNPAVDKRIWENYDCENLSAKYVNKNKLQEMLGLPVNPDIPVISIVSRLVAQKGIDLIERVLHELLNEDIQLIILGTGEEQYEKLFSNTAQYYPNKLSSNIKYDEGLARKIYSGSDMFLMPSYFEPCGLGQLISLRYGTVPITRETGGLNDTVLSYNESTGKGNGFSFTNYNAHDMLYTIRRAIKFFHDKEAWKKIVTNGMSQDFSWKKSAKEYLSLYNSLKAK